MYKKGILILLLGLIISECPAQFSLQAMIRPRSELRNGYKSLKTSGQAPAVAISQRTRLSMWYTPLPGKEKIRVGISLQDIRVWGSQPQAVAADGASTVISEAWAQVGFSKRIGVKIGRQAFSYDDERILGALDWLQQGRWHDGLLLHYEDSLWALHLGGAFNQGNERLSGNYYQVAGNYKHLHFLWATRNIGQAKISALVVNQGLQGQDSITSFSQTAGIHATYRMRWFSLQATGFYQMGKDEDRTPIRAYLASFVLQYQPQKRWIFSMGSDLLSGTPLNTGRQAMGKTQTFNPLYGTHHKFYGLMDYFYVGSPHQQVGLWDKWLSLQHKSSTHFTHLLTLHQFSAPVPIHQTTTDQAMKPHLGIEADYSFSYTFSDQVKLQGGYCQLLASPTLQFLKGGNHTATQNWAWLMLTVSTTLLKIHPTQASN